MSGHWCSKSCFSLAFKAKGRRIKDSQSGEPLARPSGGQYKMGKLSTFLIPHHILKVEKMQWIPVLRKPYPLSSPRQELVQVCIICGFVACFLLVFQPFGLSVADQLRIPLILGEVAVVFLVLVVNTLLRAMYWHETWPVYQQILWLMWNLTLISLSLSLYVSWMEMMPWHLWAWLRFQVFTQAIGLIPITFSVVLRYNQMLGRHLSEARQLTAHLADLKRTPVPYSPATLTLTSDTGKEQLTLTLEELLFIESVGNYVEVYWQQGGKLHKNLLRSTMTQTERQLSQQPDVFRCHRTFMVNLATVQSVEGNSHGYTLTFPSTSTQVPVARSKVAELRQRLP